MAREHVLIAGTGAMACIFAARLAPYADVTLLGTWHEGLRALQEEGVRLVGPDGSQIRFSVRATSNPAKCKGVRNALVLVKSWQTSRAALQLKACLAPEGVALTLQNGLGNLEQLQEILGEERVALGVTTTGATLLGPGQVRAGGVGPTHFMAHPRLGPLSKLMQQAGFKVEITDNLEGLVWGKLAVNAGINPLTAILGVPNGELLNRIYAKALMIAAAEEVAAVAEAHGVRMPYDDPGGAVIRVANRTASNRSSMLQDMERGAPTEIDAINGAVVREGDRLGVATVVNRILWTLVRDRVKLGLGECK